MHQLEHLLAFHMNINLSIHPIYRLLKFRKSQLCTVECLRNTNRKAKICDCSFLSLFTRYKGCIFFTCQNEIKRAWPFQFSRFLFSIFITFIFLCGNRYGLSTCATLQPRTCNLQLNKARFYDQNINRQNSLNIKPII